MQDFPKTRQGGQDWAAAVRALGFRPGGHDGVVTVAINFEAGNAARYHEIESAARTLMSGVPVVALGSTWGSTSNGVGGAVALDTGSFVLNMSGVSKNFVKGIG